MGFTSAAVVMEQRNEMIKVTTGCKELDNILEGGCERRLGSELMVSQLALWICRRCTHAALPLWYPANNAGRCSNHDWLHGLARWFIYG